MSPFDLGTSSMTRTSVCCSTSCISLWSLFLKSGLTDTAAAAPPESLAAHAHMLTLLYLICTYWTADKSPTGLCDHSAAPPASCPRPLDHARLQ